MYREREFSNPLESPLLSAFLQQMRAVTAASPPSFSFPPWVRMLTSRKDSIGSIGRVKRNLLVSKETC